MSAASTLSQRRPCSGVSSCNSSGPTSPLSPLALRDATAKMAKLSVRHAYRADYAGLCAECRRNLSTLSVSPHHDAAIAHGTTAPSTAATRFISTATCSGPRWLQQISRQIAMQHAELLELKAAMQTLTSLHPDLSARRAPRGLQQDAQARCRKAPARPCRRAAHLSTSSE